MIFAGYKSAYGRLIEIDHGDGVITKYGHLNSIKVKKGDLVAHRDYIGEVGTSGRVTGSHTCTMKFYLMASTLILFYFLMLD